MAYYWTNVQLFYVIDTDKIDKVEKVVLVVSFDKLTFWLI